MDSRTIALSGELGSGKSSVTEQLAAALGARRVSTGGAQRQIAEQRGISTLELNRLAETDPTIDDEIDSVFRTLASVREPLVVDSRLAWHFLPDSVKVHLVVDPAEGASRILRRTGAHAEHYESLEEALARIDDRVQSERRRFQVVYGIDIFRLRNYDLVVDTTQASTEEVADRVLASVAGSASGSDRPSLFLAPRRIRWTTGPAEPSGGPQAEGEEAGEGEELVDEVRRHGFSRLQPLAVAYSRPTFSLLDGRQRLHAARRSGLSLVPAVLQAEEGDPVGADATAPY